MLPLTAVVSMDVAQQAYVQVRAEERVRTGSDIKNAETELNPQLRYDFIWRGGQNHFVAIYQPRFIYTSSWDRRLPSANVVNPATLNLRDPNDTPLSALHNGGLGYEMVRRRWRLSLYQFAAYGPIFTTSLLIPAPWNGEALPPDPNPMIPATIGARFNLVFAQTQFFVPIRLSPRSALTPGLTYNAFGGADDASRGVIALTQGPMASLTFEHLATRDDRLTTNAAAAQIDTTFQDANRESVLIARTEATQAWRHWYSRHVSTDVMAGAAFGGDVNNGYSIFSLGHVALLYDSWQQNRIPPGAPPYDMGFGRGSRFQFGAIAKVAPWIDLFSGELEQRFVVSLASNYTVGRTTLRASLAQARVVNTPQSVAKYQIVYGEGGIRFRLTPELAVDAGARLGYQNFDNAVRFNEMSQATAFAGIFWAPLPARF